MLKILQFRLQQYMNWELLDTQAELKGRETRDQITNIRWIIQKAREFQENIYLCFIDYSKSFNCVDHNKLWKILKEIWIPDHLTCLLRNVYGGQDTTIRTRHGTTDWFKIGKGGWQSFYRHSACLNLMQTTLCKMLGWMTHKLESRLPGEISTNSDMQVIPL